MDDAQRRKLLRAHYDACDRRCDEWAARGYRHPAPPHIPFPAECLDMVCGARTRAGTPCKQRTIYRNGRCKFHGGLSTGPRTAAGKAVSAENGRVRKGHSDANG